MDRISPRNREHRAMDDRHKQILDNPGINVLRALSTVFSSLVDYIIQFAQILPLPQPSREQIAATSPDWIVHASQLGNIGFFVQLARDHPTVDLSARIACDHFFWMQRDRDSSKRAVSSPHAATLLLSPHNVPSLPSAFSTHRIVNACVEPADLCASASLAVSEAEPTFAHWERDFGASVAFHSLAAKLESRRVVVERTDADDRSEHARHAHQTHWHCPLPSP
ncbi:hypothetical protein BLNAU_17198 [Blattamonas nauphoetae]|uniref:Uncharacterized protein n=1 Tax=Blattamonas nauphoetae TaxID=2049346 RepID=A0ABQ9X7M0_9EUKA|nr:hypothetical protein BLNAU_17198 [Blattamonas nauphoetae]